MMEINKELNDFEEETKIQLMQFEHDADNSKIKIIIERISNELERLFNETKRFVSQHSDLQRNEQVVARLKKSTQSAIVFIKTQVYALKEDEKIQEMTLQVMNKCKETIDYLQEHDTFIKVKDNVNETILQVKNDERVKEGIHKAKTKTLAITRKALLKVEEALKNDDDKIVIHKINYKEDTEE